MATTKTFVIKREIIPISNEYEILEKYNRVANQIYNACLNHVMKQYNKLRHDREFQDLQERYKSAKKNNLDLSDFRKEYSAFDQKYGLTEYSLHAFVKVIKQHFNLLGIDECQKLATRAFRAYKNFRYGKANKVNFKKRDSEILIEGKSKNSACHYKNDIFYLGKNRKFNLAPLDKYQQEALKHKVKYAGVTSEVIRGKKRWFAIIVLEGVPPLKKRFPAHPLRRVSIDLGPTIAAISSAREVNIYDLSENLVPNYKKIRNIQRTMDRSRRTTNPWNYNNDGTCKPRKELKELHHNNKWWVESKRYRKLKAQLKEINRHLRILRQYHHEKLANHIISLGREIFVEKLNLQSWQKRSKNTTINPKTGRPFSKKRFGRSISRAAPGTFLEIIERKLAYYNSKLYRYNPYKIKASQYNHITDEYTHKELSDRIIIIDGIKFQRDMYSAYVGQNVEYNLTSIYKRGMAIGFNRYLKLQNEAIERLKNTSLNWYVS